MFNGTIDRSPVQISKTLQVVIFFGVFGVWLATPFIVELIVQQTLQERGQFGDLYGTVNALFSGLAFAGVLIAILLQGRQLALQAEELRYTREELKRSANAQEKAQIALHKTLEQSKEDRRHESHIALLTRLNENNWQYASDDARLVAIEIFYDYKVPAPEQQVSARKLYWGTRLLHLGHINMLEQAWTARQTGPVEEFSNWERLARRLVSHLKDQGENVDQRPNPYRDACRDLWNETQQTGRAQPGFIEWLDSLA